MCREIMIMNVTPENKALQANIKTVKTTGAANWRFPPEFMLDGNTKTAYSTYSSWKGAEFIIPLKELTEISELLIDNSGNLSEVSIAVSAGDNNFRDISKTSGKIGKKQLIKFSKSKAKKIKLKIKGKGGLKISELKLR